MPITWKRRMIRLKWKNETVWKGSYQADAGKYVGTYGNGKKFREYHLRVVKIPRAGWMWDISRHVWDTDRRGRKEMVLRRVITGTPSASLADAKRDAERAYRNIRMGK